MHTLSHLFLKINSVGWIFFFFEMGYCYIIQAVLNLLCNPGWPPTHGSFPALISQMLGLQVCITMPGNVKLFYPYLGIKLIS